MNMSWPTKKLGELVEIIAGQAPPSKYYNKEGKGKPFIKVNSFGNTYPKIDTWTTKSLKESKRGDVLLSVAGTIGEVNLGIDASITRSVFALRPKREILQLYLFYFLKTKQKLLSGKSTGSSQKIITINFLKKLKIPLPPLPIQQKIVERLDAIKKAQELNDKQIALAEELFQSLLHRELDPKGKNWEVRKLGKLINFQKGKKMVSSENKTPDSEPYIGIDSLRTNTYSLYTLKKSGIRCEPNDVLLVWDGAYAGTVGIGLNGFVGSTIVKVLHSNDIDGYFLRYILERYRERIRLSAQGAAVPHLNKSFINNLKIPLPPLETQKKIIEKLSAVQEYKKRLLKQKQLLQELFESVLNKSMKGRI